MEPNEENLGSNEPDAGPGASFNIFLQMEDLLEKLKMLNYDRDFLRKSSSYKPLTKYTFITRTLKLKGISDISGLISLNI